MSDLEASLAVGTADNFAQRAQQYVDVVSAMGQRGQHVMGAFSSSLGQASVFIERLQAQLGSSQKQDGKTAQGTDNSESNSPLVNALEQVDSLINGLSQAVDTTSTVIDEVTSAAGEVKEFSTASVSAWQAITSNKSKTSGEYWSGLVDSVKNLYKEGQDVATSVGAVVDTLSGKALDKGQEAKESTVSTSPLSKDVLATNAETASTEHGLAGGANNKGASTETNAQRVFVVNMPESGAIAVQRDQASNASEPSWLDNIKSAVDIGKDLVELRKSMKERHQSDNKGDLSTGSHPNSVIPAKAGISSSLLTESLPSKRVRAPSKLSTLLSGIKLPKMFKAIKGNGIVNALAGSAELAEVWNGEGSMKDKVKQSGGVVGSVVGSGLGTWGGAAAGAAIGSVVPVIGTAVGGLIGGVLGSMGGGAVGESLGSTLTSWFTSDDESTSTKANKQGAHGTAGSALEKAQGEIKISVEDKRVTVSSVTAHNLNLSIAGSSMGGHQ